MWFLFRSGGEQVTFVPAQQFSFSSLRSWSSFLRMMPEDRRQEKLQGTSTLPGEVAALSKRVKVPQNIQEEVTGPAWLS